jgi:type IV pilus assembly protein PilA
MHDQGETAVNKVRSSRGFTLIEVMVVLAVIAILCFIALPSTELPVVRKQVAESLELIEAHKKQVAALYQLNHEFPENNLAAGLPKPEQLLGNFVDQIIYAHGGFYVRFGNKSHPSIKGKLITVRAVVVKDSPESPISWICGFSAIPNGMEAAADDKTTVDLKYLPISCRI